MWITSVGLLLVVAAAVFIAWPLLAPRAGAEEATPSEGSRLDHEKDAALTAIRDADFDHRVGKLSDDDHAALRAELEQRALRALAALDEAHSGEISTESGLRALRGGGGPAAETPGGGFCPSCGHRFGRAARFCAACGKKLPAGSPRSGRRRATS